jgi:hypothetical protein
VQPEGDYWVLETMRAILFGCLLIFIVSCSRESESNASAEGGAAVTGIFSSEACLPSAPTYETVSIAELIASPDKFDGRSIVVTGYYYSGFELSALYPGRRNPENSETDDGLWIYGLSPFLDLNGRHVVVSGVFDGKNKGHLGQWSGSICVSKVPSVLPLERNPSDL